MRYLIFTLILTMFSVSFASASDEALVAAKNYIRAVQDGSSKKAFSQMWTDRVRKNLHIKLNKLNEEHALAVKLHRLFLKDGSMSKKPNVFKTSPNTVSFTFPLNKPIPYGEVYPDSGTKPHLLKSFQITMEKEADQWKVAGETFIGEFDGQFP